MTPGFGPVYVVKAGTDLFRGLSFFEGLEWVHHWFLDEIVTVQGIFFFCFFLWIALENVTVAVAFSGNIVFAYGQHEF